MTNWYWWLILGILVGWVAGWLLEVFCWRRRYRQATQQEIKELKDKLDDCHGQEAHLRGEIDKRDSRIADLDQALALQTAVPRPMAAMPVEAEVPDVEIAAAEVSLAAPAVETDTPEMTPSDAPLDLADVEVAGIDMPRFSVETPALTTPALAVPAAPMRVDDLTAVRGIGPKMAAALGAAGITTFAQLAEADEAQLQGIIQAPEWRRLDYGDWIAQAQTLRDLPPAPVQDDLTRIEGIGPKYAELLRNASVDTFAELASSDETRLQTIVNAPAWRRADYPMWIEQARLIVAGDEAALAQLQDRLHRREGDNLTLVAGIGPKAAEALEAGGITSYADLAAAAEAQLAGLVEGSGLRAGDYTAWIEEAGLRAAGKRVIRPETPTIPATSPMGIPAQDLAAIRGIGPVFEQKFYEAGIGTYAQMAALSDAQIEAIIQPEEWQDFDYRSWNEQALRLAEETDTTGAIWNGIVPDDLSKIHGIGEVIEQKLYEAGIMSFADLATTTVAQLEAIVQPQAWQEMDFAGWIAQARELAS